MMATSCAASSEALVSRYSTMLSTMAKARIWSTRLTPKKRQATRASAQTTSATLAMCRKARASGMPLSPV